MRRALPAILLASALLFPVRGEEVRYTSLKALSETVGKFLPHEERFVVTGQVRSVFTREDKKHGSLRIITLADGKNGISASDRSGAPKCRHGDIVVMSGSVIRNAALGDYGISASSIRVIGHAPLPATTEVDCDDISPITTPPGFYTVKGVVTSVMRDEFDVQWNWLALRGGTRAMSVAMTNDEYPYSSLTNLIDAEIRVSGSYSPTRSRRGAFQVRHYLCAFGKDGISVVQPPQPDPFAAPALGTGDPRHRQTLHGVVKALGRQCLYIKGDVGKLVAVHLSDSERVHAVVKPGDIVTVSGFRSLTRFDRQLVQAVVRVDGHTRVENETPKAVSFRDLFTSPLGNRQVNHNHHGHLVRIEGEVASTPGEMQNSGIMRLRKDALTVEVLISEIESAGHEEISEGCIVAATGICIVDFDDTDMAAALPTWRRTLVLPRSAADIRIVSQPPWWTPPKLFAIIAVLFALLSAALAWNKVLTNRARRHGEELFREKIAHAAAEVKVEVRTSLAVELHDSISQTLTGIALQLDSAERANGQGNEGVAHFLGLARQMLGSCRRELQSCLLDLRNRTFEEKDLSEAIRRTVSPLSENADVTVRFNVPRERLSDMTVHTILRIIRELVVNAICHGKATRVRIAGEMDGEEIRFSVKDDGAGFDPGAAPGPGQGHFGLQGIRERIRDFDGGVVVESSPAHGTKVVVMMKTTMGE